MPSVIKEVVLLVLSSSIGASSIPQAPYVTPIPPYSLHHPYSHFSPKTHGYPMMTVYKPLPPLSIPQMYSIPKGYKPHTPIFYGEPVHKPVYQQHYKSSISLEPNYKYEKPPKTYKHKEHEKSVPKKQYKHIPPKLEHKPHDDENKYSAKHKKIKLHNYKHDQIPSYYSKPMHKLPDKHKPHKYIPKTVEPTPFYPPHKHISKESQSIHNSVYKEAEKPTYIYDQHKSHHSHDFHPIRHEYYKPGELHDKHDPKSHHGLYKAMDYAFEYGVSDAYHGTNFGHSEARKGYITTGSYFVDLPDGRRMHVDYVADKYGYRPTVTFDGESAYHPPPKHYDRETPLLNYNHEQPQHISEYDDSLHPTYTNPIVEKLPPPPHYKPSLYPVKPHHTFPVTFSGPLPPKQIHIPHKPHLPYLYADSSNIKPVYATVYKPQKTSA